MEIGLQPKHYSQDTAQSTVTAAITNKMAKEEKANLLGAQLNANETSPTKSLTNIEQDYFEVNEAAQIMRISTRTLYRLIALKKLKKKKLLSRTIILKHDIQTFFAKQ